MYDKKKGRPSKYKKSMSETVVSCMKKGFIVDEVCFELDIARDTFFRWVKEYPDFSDAYKKGKTMFNAFMSKIYRNSMLGLPLNEYKYKTNPAMIIFYMKAHCGWSETVVNKVDANIIFDSEIDKKLDDIFTEKDERKNSKKDKR